MWEGMRGCVKVEEGQDVEGRRGCGKVGEGVGR